MQSIAASITNRQIERRVFLTFDRVINSYCELNTPFVPGGDFEIEVDVYIPSDFDNSMSYTILDGDDINGSRISMDGETTPGFVKFVWQVPHGGGVIWQIVPIAYNQLTRMRATVTSTLATLINLSTGATHSRSISGYTGGGFSRIGGRTIGTEFFDGTIANLSLKDLATPANSQKYALDRAAGTIEHSQIGSSYITYNNLPESNREIYKHEPTNNLWVGRNELLTNPGFDADNNWGKYSGWTISGGAAHFYNETEPSRLLYQTITRPSSYRVRAEISAMTNNNLQFYDGAAYTTALTTVGNHCFDVDNGNHNYGNFTIRANQPSVGGAIELDQVSMKRILRIA